MQFDPDKMRKRFHELKAKRDAHRAKSDPIRAARDKVAARHTKEIAKQDEKVRVAEKGLYEIEQEMAMLVRAVGGQMGEPE
jgi:uncharacterized protein (DUF3084 family)